MDPCSAAIVAAIVDSAAFGIGINLTSEALLSVGKLGYEKLSKLRAEKPHSNHDLQRSLRWSELKATEYLIAAGLRRTAASGKTLFGETKSMQALAERVAKELADLPETLPETPADQAHLLLLNGPTAPAERLCLLREAQQESMQAELQDWLDAAPLPETLAYLFRKGWTDEGPSGKFVTRTWHGESHHRLHASAQVQ